LTRFLIIGSHFMASLFLFYLAGLTLSLIGIQIPWLDMRFNSEYMVTISMGIGVWLLFTGLWMNAPHLAIWSHRRISIATMAATLLTVIVTTFPQSAWGIMPAYISRKALFLDEVLTLVQMNGWIVGFLLIGLTAMVIAWKQPLPSFTGGTMQWTALSKKQRGGMFSIVTIISLFVLIYLGQGEFQGAMNHAVNVMKQADVEAFRDFLLSFGPAAPIVSALLMIFQSIIAPLPAFVVTFANGMLFGWAWGALLSWSSAMAGAILCFYLAKFLGRPVIEKLVSRTALEWTDRFFASYGKHAIFIARLVPIVSFDLMSYAAGLTTIPFWHFFWATGLGQLPATLLYSYLGQTASGTIQILFFLFTVVIALGILAVLLRPYLNRKMRSKEQI
jgi:uncharacterized membrane protein YdjX (TVP38/TMEM64 family)